MIQSNPCHCSNAASSGEESSGGANETNGSEIAMAPDVDNFSKSAELCSRARVTTMRFPAKGDGLASATLTAHFFENALRTGIDQQTRHTLAELPGLLGRSGRALLDVPHAIDRAHAGIENEFASLDPGPSAKRHLAAALEHGQQGALRDQGGAGFPVIEFLEHVGGLAIPGSTLHADGALP